ncbi:hypothetical protein F4810DRAFT_674063 [Camillea tinctor]|nr:hypothetical protein F4810DRAFT_674063 [Camillea tinctor]
MTFSCRFSGIVLIPYRYPLGPCRSYRVSSPSFFQILPSFFFPTASFFLYPHTPFLNLISSGWGVGGPRARMRQKMGDQSSGTHGTGTGCARSRHPHFIEVHYLSYLTRFGFVFFLFFPLRG